MIAELIAVVVLCAATLYASRRNRMRAAEIYGLAVVVLERAADAVDSIATAPTTSLRVSIESSNQATHIRQVAKELTELRRRDGRS